LVAALKAMGKNYLLWLIIARQAKKDWDAGRFRNIDPVIHETYAKGLRWSIHFAVKAALEWEAPHDH